MYSVSQKIPPDFFLTFFPNGLEFLVQILHACYTFVSTLDYKVLFNYLQLMMKLRYIKLDHHYMLKMPTIG